MRHTPPSGMHVIKKEDKEATLREFILQDIEARKSGQSNDCSEYLVIARCFDSPVIAAIVGLKDTILGSGLRVRSVVTTINGFETYALFSRSGAILASAGIRLATDPRLFDAHEQLILNNQTCWTGDVIRREPAKRDAYERFSHDDASAVKWSRSAFRRIWAASIDSTPTGRTPHKLSIADLERQLAVSANLSETISGPQVGTRH